MANIYCSSVAYTAVAQFAVSTAYTVGQIVRQLAAPTVGNERCFRCTTAGTSAGTEAAWNLSKSATTTQGTAVFTEVTGVETYQAPGAWAAPHARLQTAGASGWMAAGDTIYVAHNHAETQGASVTVAIQATTGTSTRSYVLCVDAGATGHVPPIAGDRRATATFTITGNFALTWNAGNCYIYGLTFHLQSGGNNNQSNAFSTTFSSHIVMEACAIRLLSTANSSVNFGPNLGGKLEWINTTLYFGNVTAQLTYKGSFVWRNTPSAFSGSVPVGANAVLADPAASLFCADGVDLSAISNKLLTQSIPGSRAVVTGCRLASTAVLTVGAASSLRADFINCDSGGAVYRNEVHATEGDMTTETVAVVASGASDGTTPVSWKIVTPAAGITLSPGYSFEALPIAVWNSSTGSSRTVAVEAILNGAGLLTNAGLWMEIQYLGTAGSTLASTVSTGAGILGTASSLPASSADWTAGAPLRANSTVYNAGTVVKLASNPGRLFFCTSTGTTAASEPAGYASAVDGGSVTDGTVVFRAGVRMKLSAAITPQIAGLIRVTPKVGVANTTLYIDPLLRIT